MVCGICDKHCIDIAFCSDIYAQFCGCSRLGNISVWCDGEYADEGTEEMIVLLMNIYDYIGWKYAPEIKMLEYVAQLVKR